MGGDLLEHIVLELLEMEVVPTQSLIISHFVTCEYNFTRVFSGVSFY